MENRFVRFRQKAIDWLNGSRNFDEGIRVLEESRFKPGVVAKLKKQGVNGPSASARLKFLMRELIQAWAKSSEEVQDNVDPDTGVEVGQEQEETADGETLKLVEAAGRLETGEQAFPPNVASVIREYSFAYKKRDMLHKQLGELPEDNDEATMLQRKELTGKIAELSDMMEKLYPLYEKYSKEGQDVSDEDMKRLENNTGSSEIDSEEEDADESSVDYSTMGKEELQKLRKSVATKIARANNMLEYQKETKKGQVPNPMPDCPARVKYEKKIARLSAELEKIEYAIAGLD